MGRAAKQAVRKSTNKHGSAFGPLKFSLPAVTFPAGPHLFLESRSGAVLIEQQNGVSATIRIVRPVFSFSAIFDVVIKNTQLTKKDKFFTNKLGYLNFQNEQPAVDRDVLSTDDGTYQTEIYNVLSDDSSLFLNLTVLVSPLMAGTPPSPSPVVSRQSVVFYENFLNGRGNGALNQGFGNIANTNKNTVLIMGAGSAKQPASPTLDTGYLYGHGNGLFEVRARLIGANIGDGSGPAVVLWQSDDVWPGSEIDLGELTPDGIDYFALHWRDETKPVENNGQNQSVIYPVPSAYNDRKEYTRAALLTNTKVTFFINDVKFAENTDHPAPDAFNGGMNHTLGFLNNSSNTGIEARWCRWTPLNLVPAKYFV